MNHARRPFDLLRDEFGAIYVEPSAESVRPWLREACELFGEARSTFEQLDAEASPDWSGAMLSDVARFERVLMGGSRFDYSRPGELNLADLRATAQAPRTWPDSALLAGVALVAASTAGEFADDAAELARYLGAAREALALADALDAEARLKAAAPAIETGQRVREKNREAAKLRGRDLRKQGAATRKAVAEELARLGSKATAGAIALRLGGISRQRVAQILSELKKATNDRR